MSWLCIQQCSLCTYRFAVQNCSQGPFQSWTFPVQDHSSPGPLQPRIVLVHDRSSAGPSQPKTVPTQDRYSQGSSQPKTVQVQDLYSQGSFQSRTVLAQDRSSPATILNANSASIKRQLWLILVIDLGWKMLAHQERFDNSTEKNKCTGNDYIILNSLALHAYIFILFKKATYALAKTALFFDKLQVVQAFHGDSHIHVLLEIKCTCSEEPPFMMIFLLLFKVGT